MLNLPFARGLFDYIWDGVSVDGKTFIKHHLYRGIEITLGNTIQNVVSIIETTLLCLAILYFGRSYLPSYELEIMNVASWLSFISISTTVIKQLLMLLMATIRSMAQEYRNFKRIKE